MMAPLRKTRLPLPRRKAETEADIIGIQLASRACYDPSAAVAVFQKLEAVEKAQGGDGVPNFLRTHPVSSERIRRIKEVGGRRREGRVWEWHGCGGDRCGEGEAGWAAPVGKRHQLRDSRQDAHREGLSFERPALSPAPLPYADAASG